VSEQNDAELRQQIIDLQNQLALVAADQERDAAVAQEAANKLNLVEAMLAIVPVGVVVSDNAGQIIMGNKAVEDMVRHPVLHSEDVDDYEGWVSFHEDGTRVKSHEYPLVRVISEDKDFSELDVHYQRGDGSRFWMRIVGQPVFDKSGTRIGAAVALIDIDRERQLSTQQKVLIGELNHRVKNAFSVVQSIVSQSLRTEQLPDGLREKIDRRLHAYAAAHAKLVGSSWERADLQGIVDDIVVKIAGERLTATGPALSLPSRQALAISMAFYELATNAVKYGALSTNRGSVDLTWDLTKGDRGAELSLRWKERDGPEVVEPSDKGFGSFIIDRALTMETGGTVDATYGQTGFEWHLTMPIDEVDDPND